VRQLLLLALFTLGIAAAAAASPGGPHGFGEPPHDELIARHAAELGISDATLAQIRALSEQHRAEAEVMIRELHTQKLALRGKLHAAQPNEAEVIALARKIGTLETDLSVARLSSMMRIHALLTPEQTEALHEKMRGRFHERRALLEQTRAACEAEIAQHCTDEDAPPGHAVMCLMHKRQAEKLTYSAACEDALRALPKPHMIRHPVPPPGDDPAPFDVLVAEGDEES